MMVFQEQQEQTYESESLSEVLRKAADFVDGIKNAEMDEVIVIPPSSGFVTGQEATTKWAVVVLYSDKEPV